MIRCSQRNLVNSFKSQDGVKSVMEDQFIDNLFWQQKLLTAQDVAKLLQVSVKTIYLWAKTFRIPSVRLGETVRFRQSDIFEILNGKRNI